MSTVSYGQPMTEPVQPAPAKPAKPAPSKGVKIFATLFVLAILATCGIIGHSILTTKPTADPTIAATLCENAIKGKLTKPATFSQETYTTKGSTWDVIGNVTAGGQDGVWTCTAHWDGNSFAVTDSGVVFANGAAGDAPAVTTRIGCGNNGHAIKTGHIIGPCLGQTTS